MPHHVELVSGQHFLSRFLNVLLPRRLMSVAMTPRCGWVSYRLDTLSGFSEQQPLNRSIR